MSFAVLPVDHSVRPLEGKRVVLTRPTARAGDFEARVRALGGEPVIAPAIAIAPPESWTAADSALRRIESYDWIAFTSVNAVRAFIDRSDALGLSRELVRSRYLAAVGPTTAAAVAAALRAPDVVPLTHTAEFLADELRDVEGLRLLFPHGDLAGDALVGGLRQHGALVDDVIVYRTVAGAGIETIAAGLRAGTVDVLLFASASAVSFVARALAGAAGNEIKSLAGVLPRYPVVLCIGPVTADAARRAGLEPATVAESATQDELINSAAQWFIAHAERGDST